MDWLDGLEKYVELKMVAKELGLDPRGRTFEDRSQSLAAINIARILYNRYIDATQIEELADVEGVGA
jgi:hypothetical protein